MFVQGQLYRRRDLHERFGGQRQGGISTPAGAGIILLFTGEGGEQHGYSDGWSDDGIFLYTGEGQVGDMSFVRGNAAIRDHLAQGKELHLFEQARKAFVRYIGQMVCTGWQQRTGPDTTGNARQVIVFELTPLDEFAEAREPAIPDDSMQQAALTSLSLAELRRKALSSNPGARTPRERRSFCHLRSEAIRLYAEQRANGVCEGCKQPAPFTTKDGRPYLEVHHIRRLSDGGPDHPEWVAAICPNCHRRVHHAGDGAAYNDYLRQAVQAAEAIMVAGF